MVSGTDKMAGIVSSESIPDGDGRAERDTESPELEIIKVELPDKRKRSGSDSAGGNYSSGWSSRSDSYTSETESSDENAETDRYGRIRRKKSRSKSPINLRQQGGSQADSETAKTAATETGSGDGNTGERDTESPEIEIVMVELPKKMQKGAGSKKRRRNNSDPNRSHCRRRKYYRTPSSSECSGGDEETDKFGRLRKKKHTLAGSEPASMSESKSTLVIPDQGSDMEICLTPEEECNKSPSMSVAVILDQEEMIRDKAKDTGLSQVEESKTPSQSTPSFVPDLEAIAKGSDKDMSLLQEEDCNGSLSKSVPVITDKEEIDKDVSLLPEEEFKASPSKSVPVITDKEEIDKDVSLLQGEEHRGSPSKSTSVMLEQEEIAKNSEDISLSQECNRLPSKSEPGVVITDKEEIEKDITLSQEEECNQSPSKSTPIIPDKEEIEKDKDKDMLSLSQEEEILLESRSPSKSPPVVSDKEEIDKDILSLQDEELLSESLSQSKSDKEELDQEDISLLLDEGRSKSPSQLTPVISDQKGNVKEKDDGLLSLSLEEESLLLDEENSRSPSKSTPIIPSQEELDKDISLSPDGECS